MPLTRSLQPSVPDADGDVNFTMTTAEGKPVRCVADRDYLIAVAPTDDARPTSEIFAQMRELIEMTACDEYDLRGPDEGGVVRLVPLIA
jgi:hypothetical protein